MLGEYKQEWNILYSRKKGKEKNDEKENRTGTSYQRQMNNTVTMIAVSYRWKCGRL